ncbi:MAG: glycosyltransferase [Methanobacteriaceae archaeon]|jgi:GT2 family glycosyltransferase/glycosyltransferase involved in cell wall biosynthesis|nr:glycosyltransferase [Methanobacteriaceae archaeon]MDO9627237.1 glycosyltransferase [Methanobacteriaceae archaeon]
MNRPIKQKLISTFPYAYIILNSKKTGLKVAFANIKGYKSIKKYELLNKSYYLHNNPDVRLSGIDPILNYIYHGFKEGRKPSPQFDGDYYLRKYSDVKNSRLNPLVHYSLYGLNERRETINPKFYNLGFEPYYNSQIEDIINALDSPQKISIIIPIYNAFEDTEKCIESVLKHTKIPFEMVLIDDFSTDERIEGLLSNLEGNQNIKIIRNEENKGFVKTVNIGMKSTEGDIVLLNSDTIVTPKWLTKLVVAAYSEKQIGTVTALSNAAGAFSIPGIKTGHPQLKIEDVANLVEKVAVNKYMEVPTGNGFCMFIKRDLINEIGLLDEESFGMGYCEENDFCMRALEKYWTNIIDESTYIYHKGGSSFSDAKKDLLKKNRAILDQKHPQYTRKVREFLKSDEYVTILERIKNALENENLENNNKKRILYVIHKGGGGTVHTNQDLIRNVGKNFDCYILSSSSKEIILLKYVDDDFEEIFSWAIKSEWSASDFYNSEFRDIYFNVLNGLKIDIVHLRHLIKHTFDLPSITSKLGLPMIISFHDFYFICPSYNLLDDKNNYCAGECTEGDGQCMVSMVELDDLPILKDFIPQWRNEISKTLDRASAFVTTSECVKDIFTSIYPQLSTKNFKIIEHGRDFDPIEKNILPYEIPEPSKPVKIVFPGNINNQKGLKLIKDLMEQDKNSILEFHFMGSLDPELEDCGIYHGKYDREDFCKIIENIKPSFIGILSIWPETYCHTLSEAWSCGVPVLTTNLGAQKERTIKNNGGWFLDYQNPIAAYQEIIRISNSPEEYEKIARTVQEIKFKTTKEMANDYLKIYYSFLN